SQRRHADATPLRSRVFPVAPCPSRAVPASFTASLLLTIRRDVSMSLPAVTSRGRYLALFAALLGWMFDGMEMGLFPLVGRDALRELLPTGTDADTVNRWYGVILACFLVGAATGGVLFGWLGDKIGRVR